jgi:hypothetical protein
MEKNVLEIEKVEQIYDFKIEGLLLEGFKRVDTWESFIKFKDFRGNVIIGYKSLDPIQAAFTEILGEGLAPASDIILISASPSILEELRKHRGIKEGDV